MTYQYTDLSNKSIETVLAGVSADVPVLIPMLLFFEFMVLMLVGYSVSRRNAGYSNILAWASIAGLVTSTTASFLLMVDGLVSVETVIVTIVIAIAINGLYFVMNYIVGEQ